MSALFSQVKSHGGAQADHIDGVSADALLLQRKPVPAGQSDISGSPWPAAARAAGRANTLL
jgi:hypothetical protein